jgi:hypothetical protein
MTVKVTIDLNRKLSVAADIDSVFSLLSNVPASAEHFPKVHGITALSDNSYRWDMEKVGLGTYSIQTSYACLYISDSDAKTIVWTYMDTPAKSTYQCSLLCCEAVQKSFFFVLYPSCLNLNQGLKLA